MLQLEVIIRLIITLIILGLSLQKLYAIHQDPTNETIGNRKRTFKELSKKTITPVMSTPNKKNIREESKEKTNEENIQQPILNENKNQPFKKKQTPPKQQENKKSESETNTIGQGQLSPEKKAKKLQEIKFSALSHKERGKSDQYEKKLIEGLAMDSDNTTFLELLGDHYFDTGNHIKAQTLLKKLINKTPENHKAIRQIGQIYIHQEDFDTARILIEKAISIKSDNPKYHISLVDIYYTQNNLREAIKSMEKILKLRPKNISYLLSIATLHEEASQPTKAFTYYSKIIELDPMNEQAKGGLKRLG